MNVTEMKQDECQRCGHTWYRRKPEGSIVCPRCKSPYWQTKARPYNKKGD